MATRSRDNTLLGKEKRGTPPSSPSHPTVNRLRSPNSPKTNSPVRKQADNSTTSTKTVPNYLKPTVSSSNDQNIHNKPTLGRARSFNKPPVASSQKPANPKERILRSSSSFSGKTSTPQKPLTDKLSRAPYMTKDATGKHVTSQYSRPTMAKKTSTSTNKQDGITSQDDTHKSKNDQDGTPEASIVTISPHAMDDVIPPQAETGQHDMHGLGNDQDSHNDSTTEASITTNSPLVMEDVIPHAELSKQEDNQELPVIESERDVTINNRETSAIEDQEELNANINNVEIEDLQAVDSSSIVAENQEIIKIEEPEETLLVEETNTSNHKEAEEIIKNLPHELHLEESTIRVVQEAATEEGEVVHNQQEKEEGEGRNQGKEAATEEGEVVHSQQDKEEGEGRNQGTEATTKEGEVKQETNTTVASSKPQRQVVQGKKESVVSNDVIEETASKLREQRKNRVRALAGAFETVISLQEPKV